VTRSRPSMSSNSSIFADRGDPWVSEREGREKFGRNLSREQPDMDAFLFAGKAKKEDGEMIKKRGPEPDKPVDIRRLLVSKVLSTKRIIARPREKELSHDEAVARLEGVKHG
jgi:hypothetical protein